MEKDGLLKEKNRCHCVLKMLVSFNMYEEAFADKNVHEELKDYMTKAGLHHFMELEERTDLLTICTQDPLSSPAVIPDPGEGSIHLDARNILDSLGLDVHPVSVNEPVVLEKPIRVDMIDENIATISPLLPVLITHKAETTQNDDYDNGTSELIIHNSKCKNQQASEVQIESARKVKQKGIRQRKRRKNGKLLKDQAKKKKLEKQSLTCQICKLQKTSLKELNRHFNEHVRKSDNKFQCTLCEEAIPTYDKFIEHLKSHKNSKEKKLVKSFQCDTCSKTFQFRCLLKDHKNLHTGYRPYLCSNCGKAFSLKASLKQHSRIHSTVKKHKCIYCDFSVYVKADLVKHIRTHTGERPYICEICGEGYIQSSHLVVHKRSHSGERPYKCDLCNRGFTKKGDVIRHRRIHTGELPYLCQVCGKAFRQSTQCSNHVKHHHPGTVDGKLNIPGYIPTEHGCVIK